MSARNKTANKIPTAPAHRHKIPGALVSLDTALLHVAKYDSHENALIIFESAINKCLISLDYAREIIKKIPRTRAEKLLSRLCVSSQSGSETRVRNFIQSLRFHVLPQCKISRIGTWTWLSLRDDSALAETTASTPYSSLEKTSLFKNMPKAPDLDIVEINPVTSISLPQLLKS